MSTHHFTLIVEGADLQDEAVVNSLFESGCDDALVGSVDGAQFIDFDREAASLDDAVLSAVADVQQVDGVHVVRVATVRQSAIKSLAKERAMNAETQRPLIDAVPGRHSGHPCFAGTRVPVSTLFECLAGGDSLSAFLAAFPSVGTEQVRFALHEAATGFERPGVRDGDLCFIGSDVPVRDLFAHLRSGHSLGKFLKRCSDVTHEQAEFALRQATAKIERDYGLTNHRASEQQATVPTFGVVRCP